MGGVDIHDQYCSRVLPILRSKKWTWDIFERIIQSTVTNAVVLYNTANNNSPQTGIKQFVTEICKGYLQKN